jgi:hypothetical protein
MIRHLLCIMYSSKTRGGFHEAIYTLLLKFALSAHPFFDKFTLILPHAFAPTRLDKQVLFIT